MDFFHLSFFKAIEAFEKYKCFKWLSDDRKFDGVLRPDDWKWEEVNFTDRIIKAGWKYSAMVLPESVLAKISTTALVNYFAGRGLDAKFFTELNEAQKWIDKK